MEVLLYGYGSICLCMLAFNIIHELVMRGSQRRLTRESGRMGAMMELQLGRIRQGLPVEQKHLRRLRRKLSRVNGLLAFDRVMEALDPAGGDLAAADYLRQIHPVFLHLSLLYCKRENLQAAYFAYFLSKHRQMRQMPMDAIQEILVGYMRRDSLYCRTNALTALYAFGSPERVVEAVALQDQLGMFFHEKVLTDGLLSFQGDQERLTHLLWAGFEGFSDRTRLCVLNYIRFRTGSYCREMLQILQDPGRDQELRLSALRYLGRYAYPPARAFLLGLLREPEPVHWEYAAVAATALASYPGEDTVQGLMDAMHSRNWYVRANAAASLERQGLEYSDLIQVVGGRDRYAREMLMYRLDVKRAEKEKEDALCGT